MNKPDVLIIGGGLTGAVVAKRLSEANVSVVCLEQGDWPDYNRVFASRPEFEQAGFGPAAMNPNLRGAEADYPIEDTDSEVAAVMYSGVGGGTVIYGAQWQRNAPSDFRVRTLDGVADDWPLSYEDLAPYYVLVERDFAVSGSPGDPSFPPGGGPPLPPAPLRKAGHRIARAHNELGWHWWPGSNAIATRPHDRLNACTQRATCRWGCVERAKASTDLTHWPVAIERGAELITGARVRRIVLDDNGLAAGAIYVDRAGREHMQPGEVTILAANAIGTARLLLASAEPRQPDGLANSSGLVGKRLMTHPHGTVVGIFDEDIESAAGVKGNLLYSREFYETDASRGFVRGAKWGLHPTGGPLACSTGYHWGQDNEIFGSGFEQTIKERLGRSVSWGIIGEDLPEERNRIELDSQRVDSDGIPAPKIVYRMSENSRRLIDFQMARATESLSAAGASKVIQGGFSRDTGWHLLGTTKMGLDPDTSVVDANGRTHDVPNLYVMDGSVWPTSGGTNPSATIAALALRMTEKLLADRNNQAVSR